MTEWGLKVTLRSGSRVRAASRLQSLVFKISPVWCDVRPLNSPVVFMKRFSLNKTSWCPERWKQLKVSVPVVRMKPVHHVCTVKSGVSSVKHLNFLILCSILFFLHLWSLWLVNFLRSRDRQTFWLVVQRVVKFDRRAEPKPNFICFFYLFIYLKVLTFLLNSFSQHFMYFGIILFYLFKFKFNFYLFFICEFTFYLFI